MTLCDDTEGLFLILIAVLDVFLIVLVLAAPLFFELG